MGQGNKGRGDGERRMENGCIFQTREELQISEISTLLRYFPLDKLSCTTAAESFEEERRTTIHVPRALQNLRLVFSHHKPRLKMLVIYRLTKMRSKRLITPLKTTLKRILAKVLPWTKQKQALQFKV